ncbi:MAG: DUF2141 domain-containing protein [Leptospira sp.]|jgi:uncharacterized protein (DUF2141 family)|nr:DUF2141 domain-containing protein [Leptospira sp.]
MKPKLKIFLISAMILNAPLFAIDLDVEIQNRKSTSSKVSCAVFEKEEGFPSNPEKRMTGVIAELTADNKTICKFKGLSAKKYAVSVLEDMNGNGTMDTTMVGFPKEPWGVSKNAPMHAFGPPTFDEAAFQLTSNSTIQIKLNQ